MRVECAWCGEFIKDKEPLDSQEISHGICEKCWAEEQNMINKLKKEPLKK